MSREYFERMQDNDDLDAEIRRQDAERMSALLKERQAIRTIWVDGPDSEAARARTPDPDNVPAVRRVVALPDDVLDEIEQDDETDDLQKWRAFAFMLGFRRRRCSDLRKDLNRALRHRDEEAGHR